MCTSTWSKEDNERMRSEGRICSFRIQYTCCTGRHYTFISVSFMLFLDLNSNSNNRRFFSHSQRWVLSPWQWVQVDSLSSIHHLGCNRTVDARFLPSSRLTSPHFPRPYGHNHSCETTIQVNIIWWLVLILVQVPDKKRIFLVFRSFDIEHPSTLYNEGSLGMVCEHDYLMVRNK